MNLTVQAQTTPNVQVEILGVGAEYLLGGDLTDPENDGLDALGAATDPSWNWKSITSSHEPDFEGGENSFNIFDNKVGGGNDKWCCDDPTPDNPVWVAVEFAQPYSLTHFTVTSGNDTPTRDPTDWAIQGSLDGETWTDIYRFQDSVVPWTERNQVVKFTLPVPATPYTWFRYIAYDTPADLHQLNELELFGFAGTLEDTDGDGMPNDWETAHGLNPNDPTDAAKDCNGNGVTNLDEFKTGMDPCDTTRPAVVSAVSTGAFNTVIVTFSEALEPVSAEQVANYTITPSLAVTAASYRNKVVTLTTAAQAPDGTLYTVTVKGVKDLSNFEVPEGSNTATFYSYILTRNGMLKFSYWGGIQGTPVDNLLADPRYPASPDEVGALYSFNSRNYFADDSHDNYGATIEGFITPTESGDYRFFVYSDDASQLWMSTDETEENLVGWPIAEETGCCNYFTEPDSPRTSEPIPLEAGKKYFARMIYKEGGGGDYGQVAWRKEGDATPAGSLLPIPGKYLSSAVDLPFPAEGVFLTRTPAPGAKNVKPNTKVTIVHIDGKVAWTSANVTVTFDGAPVAATLGKEANELTISYDPATLFAGGSVHTIAVNHPDPSGNPTSTAWSFTVAAYKGPALDKVKSYPALIMGNADYTADAGGATGTAGDFGMDLTTKGGPVQVLDAAFMSAVNAATAADELSVSLWIKKYDIADSSAIWFSSPTQARVFQAHTPWSNNNIYFDTAGCCDGTTQRINAGIDTFLDYSGEVTWWNQWRLYVFTKKADQKNIYIDGTLFLNGSSSGTLSTDIDQFNLGADNTTTAGLMHAIIDEVAVYGKELTEANITALKGGTKPSALPAAVGLVAYWDFNSPPAPAVTITVTRSGGNVTITSDPQPLPAGFVLQTAPSINGPWATQAGANTPITVPIGTEAAVFLRAAKP